MEIQLAKGKKWFYRLVALKNNKTLMTSETYYSKWNARRAAKKVAELNGFQYIEVR